MKIFLIIWFIFINFSYADEVYESKIENDATTLLPTFLLLSYSFDKSDDIKPLTILEVGNLNSDNINFIDKSAVNHYSKTAVKISDYFLGASFLAPALLLTNNRINSEIDDFLLMYGEVGIITYAVTNMVKVTTGRIRPYAYNSGVPIEKKLNPDIKKSFFSAHTSSSFAYMVFTAKVFSDYFPDSKYKPYVWLGCLSIASTTGVMRYFGGKHFPTDIITGAVVGSLIGYIIPEMKKNKKSDNYISPAITRISFSYSF